MANRLPFYSWGEGEPLLFLHGFMGSAEDAQFIVGRRLVAVDLPGHGSCEAELLQPHTMEESAQLVVATLRANSIVKPLLYGYSMGGRLALYLALTYPELFSGLVLESASPGLAGDAERAQRVALDCHRAEEIERESLEIFLRRWYAQPMFANLDGAAMVARRAYNSSQGLANSLRAMGTGAAPSLWGQLPVLSLPTTLIVGAEDTKFVAIAHEMAGLIPRCELQVVPAAGHCVHCENPAAINSFLEPQ